MEMVRGSLFIFFGLVACSGLWQLLLLGRASLLLDSIDRRCKGNRRFDGYFWLAADRGGHPCVAAVGSMWDNMGDHGVSENDGASTMTGLTSE